VESLRKYQPYAGEGRVKNSASLSVSVRKENDVSLKLPKLENKSLLGDGIPKRVKEHPYQQELARRKNAQQQPGSIVRSHKHSIAGLLDMEGRYGGNRISLKKITAHRKEASYDHSVNKSSIY